MTNKEKVEMFLKDLVVIAKKHEIEGIGSCGCCGGTYVSLKDNGDELYDGLYLLKMEK